MSLTPSWKSKIKEMSAGYIRKFVVRGSQSSSLFFIIVYENCFCIYLNETGRCLSESFWIVKKVNERLG